MGEPQRSLRTSLSFSVGGVGGGYGVKRVFQRLEIIMHVYVVMKMPITY